MEFRVGDKITVIRGREQGHTGVIIDIDKGCIPPIAVAMDSPCVFNRMFFFDDEIKLREEKKND